jgi:rRNA maturation endonuclease Nob1
MKKKLNINKMFPYTKFKYRCRCGKRVLIRYDEDFRVCPRCGRKVRKDNKSYFRDKVRQLLNRRDYEGTKKNTRYYKLIY